MEMSRNLSRFILTSHVAFSIGWLGAVAVFLVFAVVGLTTTELSSARSAYWAMELSAWFIILPFSLVALLTGILQASGTKWGLFKHYWIFVKLIATVVITLLLLLHLGPIETMANLVTGEEFSLDRETGLRLQLILDAAAALLVLFIITAISIYKPWGMIKTKIKPDAGQDLTLSPNDAKKRRSRYWITAGIIILLIIILKHLLGGSMQH
jgi:hypothetical protein